MGRHLFAPRGHEREQIANQPEAFLTQTALNLFIDAHRARVGRREEIMLDEVADGADRGDAGVA